MKKDQKAQKENIQATYQNRVAELSKFTQSEMHRIARFKETMKKNPEKVYNTIKKMQDLIKELDEIGASTAVMDSFYQVYLTHEGYVEGVQLFLADTFLTKDDL
jgi:hypothetical protein